MNALNTAPTGMGTIRPSPVFFGVVAAFAAGAWLCVSRSLTSDEVAVFVFVFAGWMLSLIFHEFAHAYVAWRGGDNSIPSKGYLTLDPRKYTDPVTSIAIPLGILLIGGIPLPGGAVWIQRGALRSNGRASAVSLAGPATNLVFAAACLLPSTLGLVSFASQPVLVVGLNLLGYLQIFAFVLNMLPVPGLDGFGALEPHLPPALLATLAPVRRWGILVLILVLFQDNPVRDAVIWTIGALVDVLGGDREQIDLGWNLFRFWE